MIVPSGRRSLNYKDYVNDGISLYKIINDFLSDTAYSGGISRA